jgi:hypothetical protein
VEPLASGSSIPPPSIPKVKLSSDDAAAFSTPISDAPSIMRTTLRRSCAACAKAKHSCDLQTPKCSRCLKRGVGCVYANEPFTAGVAKIGDGRGAWVGSGDASGRVSSVLGLRSSSRSIEMEVKPLRLSNAPAFSVNIGAPIDPFDSFPSTCVPRPRVQNLIHLCEQESIQSVFVFNAHG